jgi:membrane associated rhomboid family serine protease
MEQLPNLPPPPTIEHCYRHETVPTAVHCTRCGRPICADCMIPAPVGHQCPTCVAEARAAYSRPLTVRRSSSSMPVTRALVVILIVVFAFEVLKGGADSLLSGPSPDSLVQMGGSVGALIAAGQYWRLITPMFLHAGLLHLFFNAYALWIFGSMLEPDIGSSRFLVSYLVTGFAASAASYAFLDPQTVGIGASGAIFGIFGVFLVYNYRRRDTALGLARLRMGLVLLAINALLGFTIAGIDWRAHVGGLIAGLAIGVAVDARGRDDYRRVAFIAGVIVVLAASVGLAAWRTARLHALGF